MSLLSLGTPAPAFKGQNLNGPEVDSAQWIGLKPLVLIFAPDQFHPQQTNLMKGVYDKFKSQAEMVVIVRKLPASVAMAKSYLQQARVSFPVLYDAKQEVFKAYGVENPIVVYALDSKGSVVLAQQHDPKKLDTAALSAAVAAAVA